MSKRDPMNADNVLAAAQALKDKLPELFGEEWADIEPTYHEKVAALEAADDAQRPRAMLEVVKVFRTSPETRSRFHEEVIRQDDIGGALMSMADMLDANEPDAAQALRDAAQSDSTVRKATLKAPDRAHSFKLANIVFDMGEMRAAGVAVATALSDHFLGDDVSPFVMAVGILVITQKIVEEMTVTFDEREATVLWGFAEAADNEQRTATESHILGITNAARQRIGLEDLDEMALRNALHKLEQLKTVEHIGEYKWRIVEKINSK
jgi:DNA polymerase III delta prime subunit